MGSKNKYIYVATCLFGLESLLGSEIDSLGYTRTLTMDGRIYFEGDDGACARCNIMLRFAERLYLLLGRFDALSFEELFDGTSGINIEDYIESDDRYPVTGHSIKSDLYSVPDCQKIIKKSLSVRLSKHYSVSRLPETGINKKIEFFIFKNNVSIMLELSGEPLHKRGYRPERVTAPLRETLAAAIAKISRPRENVLLRDPFCGSGTILIEGAMIMKNISPGINRNFLSEQYRFINSEVWKNARDEALSLIVKDTGFRAFGSDIDENCIRISEESSKRAGVESIIKFEKSDALGITSGGERGTIVTNPPYGERLMNENEVRELYRAMGRAFSSLVNWQMYILTPNNDFQKLFGRKADKIRKLYNGMIPCCLYQFFKNK